MLLGSRRSNEQAGASEAQSLVDLYNEIFEAVPADTAELRDECFRIRHQVYCLENNFLPISGELGGREIDEYDSRARHGLLRFRKTGACLGTVRLVLPDTAKGAAAL